MPVETVHEAAVLDENVVRYKRVNKKGSLIGNSIPESLLTLIFITLLGYVRVVTNFGPLNLELYCDAVPKTCDNFISLCKKGYYNNTKFHRSIKHFMVNQTYTLVGCLEHHFKTCNAVW